MTAGSGVRYDAGSARGEHGGRDVPHTRHAPPTAGRAIIAWTVAGLIVSQFAWAVTLEQWRPDLRDPEYGHKLRLLRRQTVIDPKRQLLLALGSSRTLNGLRPAVLPAAGPRVFNFGLTRHGPVQQWLAFDRLLRDGIRPRWVTVERFPPAPRPGGGRVDCRPRRPAHSRRRAVSPRNSLRPATYAATWFEARAVSVYDSRFAVRSWLCPTWVPWSERHDFVWTHTDSEGWLERRRPPPAAQPSMRGLPCGVRRPPGQRPGLAADTRPVAAEGIGAAVVLMPEAAWFRELYRGDADDRLRAYSERLGRECGVLVIDARDWCVDDEFRDGGHLIAAGAGRFTERFGRDIVLATWP